MSRLAAALLLLLAASGAGAATLTILHTSDLHGRVHPHDSLADKDLGEGLARVAAAVKAIRAESNPVLLVDSGDTIEGAPEQALAFAGQVGKGVGSDPIVRAMNLAGYDAVAAGNHEFDFGRDRLEASRRQARFSWLSANTLGPDGEPVLQPYDVKTIGGVRVGILGLVTPSVSSWESPKLVAGLTFGDAVAAAKKYVPILREKGACDLVVVLTHQGFEKDLRTGRPRPGLSGENQAYALATEVPGIDLLLTGHAHTVVAPRRLGKTWVSQPGRWGNTLTRFDVELEKTAAGRWKVVRIQGRNLPMKRVRPDAEIVAAIEAEHADTMRLLAEPVAALGSPVSSRGFRSRDLALLDWLHAVQLREGEADLSFCSLLPQEPPQWRAGPLTLRQIWRFYPYENSLVTVKASGRQVRQALERAAECFADPAERGRNCDTLEGAEYVIDLRKPEGSRVVSLTRGGRDIADGDTFRVALNSHRASGGGGYAMWRGVERLSEKGNVRDLLVADARARKTLRLEATGNWKLLGARGGS
ncbi:MAG: bifunctional UDP-sugar hydrolase/5'-nucleotidase [Thermoanaerobaculia bacterium]